MNENMSHLVLVFVTGIQLAVAFPTPSPSADLASLRWNMLCSRGSKLASGVPTAIAITPDTPVVNLKGALSIFLDQTNQISNHSHYIKKRWVENRYNGVDHVNFVINNFKLPPSMPSQFAKVPATLRGIESGTCNSTCLSFMTSISESLRKVTMHLEVIREHEYAEYMANKQITDIKDTHSLMELERLLYDMVCEMNHFVKGRENPLKNFYSKENIPDTWKIPPNKTERYNRDLVFVDHVLRLVASAKDSFSHLMSELFLSLDNPGALNR